jgi:uncharacterized protein (DUF488 family)
MSAPPREVFTLGHSTRAFDELERLLHDYGIACLIDVRNTPKSRRMPHFAKESLERSLPPLGIDYVHLKALGGWRRPLPGSPNGGWRSRAFQGYADHMETAEFRSALEQVMDLASGRRAAIMCAEALWWRCHRMLISDALTVRGWRVRHIGAGPAAQDHRLTPFAVVDGERLVYPPRQPALSGTGAAIPEMRR